VTGFGAQETLVVVGAIVDACTVSVVWPELPA